LLHIHNFVLDRQQDMDQLLINQVGNLIPNDHVEGHREISIITHVQPSNEWNNFRDAKASEMFADYQERRVL
jgi:hypothetical protein